VNLGITQTHPLPIELTHVRKSNSDSAPKTRLETPRIVERLGDIRLDRLVRIGATIKARSMLFEFVDYPREGLLEPPQESDSESVLLIRLQKRIVLVPQILGALRYRDARPLFLLCRRGHYAASLSVLVAGMRLAK
jgi:hypothetical protein